MGSVEQELWNIFTFYTLHGNPMDPEHIRASQFVKLARDCQIVGSTLSEADVPLTEADINVTYTAEVTRRDKVAPRVPGQSSTGDRKKMNYNDFLNAMMKLAVRVYPRSRTVDDALQRLLLDNILPLASRRCPDAVDMFLANTDVQRLFDYYRESLEAIFSFYASSDKRTTAVSASAGGASYGSGMSFSQRGGSVAPGSARGTRMGTNTMKDALGYAEFLKFASDFDLSNSVILSTIELGDIYLSSIKAVEPDSTIRKLSFHEFWESLLRCALVAYSKISNTSVIDKIRGLFLYMWRAINKSVPRAFTDRRNVSTYAGDLLSGAMLFGKRFTSAWAADGYRDYLSPDPRVLETGKTVLSRLLKHGDSSRTLTNAAGAGGGSASVGAGQYTGGGGAGSGDDAGGSGSSDPYAQYNLASTDRSDGQQQQYQYQQQQQQYADNNYGGGSSDYGYPPPPPPGGPAGAGASSSSSVAGGGGSVGGYPVSSVLSGAAAQVPSSSSASGRQGYSSSGAAAGGGSVITIPGVGTVQNGVFYANTSTGDDRPQQQQRQMQYQQQQGAFGY